YSSPASYAWTSGAGEPGAQTLTATDKAGNNGTDSITLKDDTTAPSGQTIALTGASAPYYSTASVTFSLTDGTDSSGGSGLDTSSRTVTRETGTLANGNCSSFTADAGTFTSPDTAVSNGHCYRYTFVESDNVGNQSAGAQVTAKVDTGAPSSTLANPGTPLRATVGLAASASETGWTFQCRVDGGSWASCSSPHTLSPALGEGSHTFDARATDPAGNTDGSPASYTWTVDTTAPNTSITARPSDPSNNTTPS